jgi:hypothetical protein
MISPLLRRPATGGRRRQQLPVSMRPIVAAPGPGLIFPGVVPPEGVQFFSQDQQRSRFG